MAAQRIGDLHFDGVVLEGAFEPAQGAALKKTLSADKRPIVELTPRGEMKLDGSVPVTGTYQGVWPGIQIEEDGKAKAAPSGAAWIDTNTGFLRYVRASTAATVWMANQPPKRQEYAAERYIQAIGDAAMAGARWVLSFDDQFNRKLLSAISELWTVGAALGKFWSTTNPIRIGDQPNRSRSWHW